jgi:hypothetical protein
VGFAPARGKFCVHVLAHQSFYSNPNHFYFLLVGQPLRLTVHRPTRWGRLPFPPKVELVNQVY